MDNICCGFRLTKCDAGRWIELCAMSNSNGVAGSSNGAWPDTPIGCGLSLRTSQAGALGTGRSAPVEGDIGFLRPDSTGGAVAARLPAVDERNARQVAGALGELLDSQQAVSAAIADAAGLWAVE